MFSCNSNFGWNNSFQTTPFAQPFFAQTLNMLVQQAVQQAVWQTLIMQQWQNQNQPWQQNWNSGAFPFSQWNGAPQTGTFPGTFANTFPTGFPTNTPQNQSQGNFGYAPQGPFGQNFQPTQGGWVNGQNGPGYFGTVQFQHLTPQNTPTNEVVEAATKRNGSR